jgi:hypothetical protein
MTSIPLVALYMPPRPHPRPSFWRRLLRWLPIWWAGIVGRCSHTGSPADEMAKRLRATTRIPCSSRAILALDYSTEFPVIDAESHIEFAPRDRSQSFSTRPWHSRSRITRMYDQTSFSMRGCGSSTAAYDVARLHCSTALNIDGNAHALGKGDSRNARHNSNQGGTVVGRRELSPSADRSASVYLAEKSALALRL